jgi:hypothetical protein
VIEEGDKAEEEMYYVAKDSSNGEDDRENHWKIMEKTFFSEPEAYVFFNNYAKL